MMSTFSVSDWDFLMPERLKLPRRKLFQLWLGSLIRRCAYWSCVDKQKFFCFSDVTPLSPETSRMKSFPSFRSFFRFISDFQMSINFNAPLRSLRSWNFRSREFGLASLGRIPSLWRQPSPRDLWNQVPSSARTPPACDLWTSPGTFAAPFDETCSSGKSQRSKVSTCDGTQHVLPHVTVSGGNFLVAHPSIVDFLESVVSYGAEEDDALERTVSVLRDQLHTNHLAITNNDVCEGLRWSHEKRRRSDTSWQTNVNFLEISLSGFCKSQPTSSKLSTVKKMFGYVISSCDPLLSIWRRLGEAYTFCNKMQTWTTWTDDSVNFCV